MSPHTYAFNDPTRFVLLIPSSLSLVLLVGGSATYCLLLMLFGSGKGGLGAVHFVLDSGCMNGLMERRKAGGTALAAQLVRATEVTTYSAGHP